MRFMYVTIYLRDQTLEASPEFTEEQLDEWFADYVKRIENWDHKTYNPGGHCCYCPRSAVCPALRNQLAVTAHIVRQADIEDVLAQASEDMCIDIWEKVAPLVQAAEKAREIIKLRAAASGDIIQGASKCLVLKESTRQTIRAQEAWPVMLQHLSEAEIAPCVSISKTELLDAVGAKAPRGSKKAAKEALMEELQAAGAVETTTFKVGRIVPLLPESTEKELEGNGD